MTRIKELRTSKGLKQIELAELLNIKQNTLSDWERDKNEPDINALVKMSHIFSVTVDYLLGAEEQKEPATISDDGLPDLDRELISMLCQLSPDDCRRVKDFVAGIESARRE